MRAYIERDGKRKEVKNLGWLLKHWKEVTHFTTKDNGSPIGCDLVSHLHPNGFYVSTWAQRDIMVDWLRRPVFIGLCLDGNPIEKRKGEKHYLA